MLFRMYSIGSMSGEYGQSDSGGDLVKLLPGQSARAPRTLIVLESRKTVIHELADSELHRPKRIAQEVSDLLAAVALGH